jgi:hypothetical protein
LANWCINLAVGENLSNDDQELIMDLSPADSRRRKEGKQEEQRQMVENLLMIRFGELDEKLSAVIVPLLQLPTEELSRVLLTLKREELLERFGR